MHTHKCPVHVAPPVIITVVCVADRDTGGQTKEPVVGWHCGYHNSTGLTLIDLLVCSGTPL